jgi:hypothetical protein
LRAAALLLLALACAGPLEGEMATEAVEDWSFLAQADDLELATAGGRRFRAVQAGPLVHEGELYLHASTIFSLGDAALEELLAGGGVRARAAARAAQDGRAELGHRVRVLGDDLDLEVRRDGARLVHEAAVERAQQVVAHDERRDRAAGCEDEEQPGAQREQQATADRAQAEGLTRT